MSRTLIIAEAGVNHNGHLNLALQLCDAAKEAGADIVKFQTWRTDRLITKTTGMAEYQQTNTGSQQTQYELLKSLELGFQEFRRIQEHCANIGIEFLSTPDDDESLAFLATELNLGTIKIGSGEVTNLPYLQKIAGYGRPVILSTGMSWIGEVEKAVNVLAASRVPKITLLHCTTNYPCPMPEVNLKAMQTLAVAFGLPVGYSDHTLGIEVPIAAVALGACVIEKHFTLDQGMPGPDHAASLEPKAFGAMVSAIRNIEVALGDGLKRPNLSELKIKPVVQRSIVAARPITKGEVLDETNMTLKRAGGAGLTAEYWGLALGRIASKNIVTDELVEI